VVLDSTEEHIVAEEKVTRVDAEIQTELILSLKNHHLLWHQRKSMFVLFSQLFPTPASELILFVAISVNLFLFVHYLRMTGSTSSSHACNSWFIN
jgi:hypothetical protein